MSRRTPQDERDVLLAIADVVADGTDLSDEAVFADLEEMGLDGHQIATNGAQRVIALLNHQRLSWQAEALSRTAQVTAQRPVRRRPPRDRQVLLTLARERQQSGTRVDWHKLNELSVEQLEELLADDDFARTLDRLLRESKG